MKKETKCYCGHTTTCDCGPETLEEVAERLYPIILEDDGWDKNKQYRDEWIDGAKWQQERSYNEEEVIEIIFQKRMPYMTDTEIIEWFEQFKKK
jgi:hypothetical protein